MLLSNKQVGDLGEDQFQLWAKAAGMTVTKPGTDEKGWDRFVEWTLAPGELQRQNVPLDRDDREVKALVQVKTTTKRPGRWNVKLSNWKSLIEHPGPAFFAVLEVREVSGGGIEVESLYLVHLGESRIGRYLKRLREIDHTAADSAAAGADGVTGKTGALCDEVELHKKRLSFSYSDSDCTERLTPAALRAALSAPLAGGPNQYAERKQHIRRRAGYEDGRVPVLIDVTSEVPAEYGGDATSHFADVLLGVSPLKAVRGTRSDVRFGIPSAPRPLSEKMRLEFEAARTPVRLRLRRSGTPFDRLHLDAQMQNALIRTEDSMRGKIRFLLPYGSMTFSFIDAGLRFNFSLEVPGEAQGRLDKIWGVFQLATFLSDALENGESVQIQKKSQDDSSWQDFRTLSDEDRQATGLSEELGRPDAQRLISAVGGAWRLARQAELPADLKIVPADVDAYHPQLSFVDALRAAERGSRVSHALYFSVYAEKMSAETEAALKQPQIGIADLISVRLGSHVIVVAFAIAGGPIMICSSVRGRHETFPSDTTSEQEAEGFLKKLPSGTHGYKLPVERVDLLKCYVFDAEEELPAEATLRADALKKARSLYAGTLTRGEGGLGLSV